jgi:hypothetical protein
MLDLDDPWWLVALVILIGLWVMEVAIPVAIAKPVFAVGNKYADQDVDDPDVQPPAPLGPKWPALSSVLSGLFMGMVIWRYIVSRGERRWMWLSVVAFITFSWALTLIVIAARTAHHLAGPHGPAG